MKKIMYFILLICILSLFDLSVYAADSSESDNSANEDGINGGIAFYENISLVNELISERKFNARQGHGFAAERADNLIDTLSGKNAVVVGDDNVKNGADRVVFNKNGTKIFIQDKYCATASKTIDACFENGEFRYIDSKGNPMLIEVPRDQFDEAVEIMAKKIEKGQLKNAGITDPADAKNLVRKGGVTYKQAVNIAKAGTVESLVYDFSTGTVSTASAFGISTVMNYAICKINGYDDETALSEASIEGLKTGVMVGITHVIAKQLSKSAITNGIDSQFNNLAGILGKDFCENLVEVFGKEAVKTSAKQEVVQSAARILKYDAITSVISVVVMTVPDTIDLCNKKISSQQFVKNVAETTIGVAGGAGGGLLGGTVGNVISAGTGAMPGAIVGGVVGGTAATYIGSKVLDIFIEDDAQKLVVIVQDVFSEMCIE